ncbi:MAG: amidase [Acidimicrobiales bacterium]|nr:amidase [Acidimicrobiales bacterium]
MDQPWQGDAVSLVEAFRAGERSPREELDATLAAIERSNLNTMSHLDVDRSRSMAESADVSPPFGGVPMGIKELDLVEGWPATRASVPFKDEVASATDTKIERLADAGAVFAGLTTSSEFGGVNQTWTKLNGATRNPWNPDRTPGGSSGGSAAGVAGGIFTIASGGDGGGSIRIPAGFCGLFGLKCTYGRIPHGPSSGPGNLTAVPGCLSRSVRDTARWFDVSNGFDARDPFSLPRVEGWERDLGSFVDDLRGKRAAIVVDIGNAVVAPEVVELVQAAAEELIGLAGLERVDVTVNLPNVGGAWAVSGGVGIVETLGDKWPGCADDLTPAMRMAVEVALEHYDAHAAVKVERRRTELNEAMADLFEQADLVLAATNPDVAFGADRSIPTTFGGLDAKPMNHGALTIPANIYGNPAISLPIGTSSEGLPVGLQVLAPHFQEQLLLDLALVWERERPWPLVASGYPE